MRGVRSYTEVVESGDLVLTDGAQGTRLLFETNLALDPVLGISSLALDGRATALQAVSGEYVAIAGALGLPVQLDAATYSANPDCLAAAGRSGDLDAMNRRAVQAAVELRGRYAGAEIYIAGVVGPQVDGYQPTEVPDVEKSTNYHAAQVEVLADAGVDVLYAETFSTVAESIGAARAMAATGCPFVIAPVLRADGTTPDGTRIEDFVATVDSDTTSAPLHYLINCTHPETALRGLRAAAGRGADVSSRVIGLKANGSSAPLDVLDEKATLHSDPPLPWAASMLQLHREFGMRVLGGCCGTDSRHILALALDLASGALAGDATG